MRRSTLGILVAFVVLGALYLWTRPQESARTEQAEKSSMLDRRPTQLVLAAGFSTAEQVSEQQHEGGYAEKYRNGDPPVRKE